MQCRGALRTPLRDIIKNIGACQHDQRPHSLAGSAQTSRPGLPHRSRRERPHPSLRASSTASTNAQQLAEDGTAVPLPLGPYPLEEALSTNAKDSSIVPQRLSQLPQAHATLSGGSSSPPLVGLESAGKDVLPPITKYVLDPTDWRPSKRHYRMVESNARFGALKALARGRRQQDRHDYLGLESWRDILKMLDRATPNGAHRHRKSFEIVSLPEGVSAAFRGNAGATILEVLQRSGSHIQVVSGASEMFSKVVLYGTMHENTTALQMLPEFFRVTSVIDSNASQNLADYVLKREAKEKRDSATLPTSAVEHDHPETEFESEEHFDLDLQSAIDEITARLFQRESQEGSVRRVITTDQVRSENTATPGRSEITASPIRSTWDVNRYLRLPSRERLLQRPKNTSALSLSEYVKDLIQFAPTLLPNRKNNVQDHISDITTTLIGVFEEPGTVKVATNETVDQVLRFLTKHGKYPQVRKINEILESSHYMFTASNYDVLFDAAAKATDLHNFRQLLRRMLGKCLRPTPVTWALFHNLMSRRRPEEAFKVTEAMRRKGLLANNTALVQITHDAVERDLKPLIRSDGTLSQFLLLYDRRFSNDLDRPDFNWLSRDVMNRIAHVFLKAGRNADAYEILAEFKRRGRNASVDAGTLSIFLAPTIRTPNTAKLALAVLQHFQVGLPGAVVPTQAIYQMLSIVAYRDGCFNMLRVIWRYACAAGRTSAAMRKTIMSSLLSYPPPEATRGAFKRCWGGKFAVGVADGLTVKKMHFNNERPSRSSKEETPVASGKNFALEDEITYWPIRDKDKHKSCSEWSSKTSSLENLSSHARTMVNLSAQTELPKDSSESLARKQRLQHILELDLLEVEQLRPVRPLTDMLTAAYEKDLAWRRRDIGLSRGLQKWPANDMFAHMMEDGVKVHMRPGNFASKTYTSEIPWKLKSYRRHNRQDDEVKV